MTKQAESPPEGTSDTEQIERSGPMWESTVRLVGDDEAAHRALTQLKKAIRSRVTETELPEGSQLQLVSLTTSTVTAQLEQLAAVSGDTDQQRRQQLLLAMLPARTIRRALPWATMGFCRRSRRDAENSDRSRRHRGWYRSLRAGDPRLCGCI